MSDKNKTFVIIDGNAIIHRAYHALPPLTAKDGTMVNVVYGFASMLLKVINDLKPHYLAVSFDVAGGTFRDKVYDGYKAKRVKADQELYDQIPLVHEVVSAFGIPIFEKEGFEADDVIGTLTRKIKILKDFQITSIIVTGDMDLLQLVDDDVVEVYLLKKGMSDFQLYNEKAVKDRFGFGPEHIVDYKSLRGDSSDNIPGVKGVGEKTAVQLIAEVGGVEEIYHKIKKLKDYNISDNIIKKLEVGEKNALMSKELATIRQDVPKLEFDLDKCKNGSFEREKIVDLFKKFEFYSLIKRIPGAEGVDDPRDTKTTKGTKTPKIKLIIVNKDNVVEILNVLKKEKVIACKEILNGKDVLTSDLAGLVFATKVGSYYIEKPSKEIFGIFADSKKTIVGHDLKSLVKIVLLSRQPIDTIFFDVMIASYLLNSSTRAHDLQAIVLREIGKELPSGSGQDSLFGLDPKMVAEELQLILQVYEKHKSQLEDREALGLFQDMEMALIPVLAEMELNGMAVDTGILSTMSQEVAAAIQIVEKKIWEECGKEFNVASSVQLRDILFIDMGLPTEGIKKGKTGYSTASSELEKLREIHPVIELIEEYRELEKLRNTYIDVLPALINKKTGRIHTSFNQAVAATGRLSSSDPNLQNIPIRTDLGRKVRETFIAEKGNVLVVADYSQIELRIVASLAKDQKMIEIFEKGEDIHKATAAAINGVFLKDVTKEMRRAAKEVNFGVLYGMGSFGLSSRTGISQYEAREFIRKYFEQFSEVKKYIDSTLEFAKKEGYVETLFGRRRYIPELQSSNFQLRNAGERMAINMPVQGTAADLMKMAMIRVHKSIKTLQQKDNIRMILQVHDELVFEVKKGLEVDVAELIKNEMENVTQLRVPIIVDVGIGISWGKIK